jgi:two-component system chemotaxis response regulator CheY
MAELLALVIDDSKAMRVAIMAALHRIAGLKCEEAADGAEALRKLSERTFQLVLTDINMPLMDGLKLVSHIRGAGANAAVPIVVITTESAREDRERALALGASVYLTKPVQAAQILQTVRQLLNLTG